MRSLLALGLVLAPAVAAAQVSGRGTSFWGCWPRSHLSLETSGEIIVMADQVTDVVVDGAFTWPLSSVGPSSPLVIPLPQSLRTASDRTVVPSGFRVRSVDPTRPVTVLVRVPRQAEASDDVARLLPVEELGTSYIVGAYTASLPNEPSYYAVVATEDATTVNAAVPCAGVTDTVLLDAGDVYQVFCQWRDVPADVTGALVTADKPISVLAGCSDAFVPTDYLSGDFVVEAMVPTARWGNDAYVVPLPKGPLPAASVDAVRIVAGGPGTVNYEGPSASGSYAFAAAGEFVEILYKEETRFWSTDTTFAAYMFHTGVEMADIGDPFMLQVPPVQDHFLAYRVYTPPFYSDGSYLSIIATLGGAPGVRVNGAAVASPWVPLPGGTHAWTEVALGFLGPEHVITGPEPMAVLVHGYNNEYVPNPALGEVPGSYGYPAPHSDPGCLLFPRMTAPASACAGNQLNLTAATSTALGCSAMEYRWLKDGALLAGCDTFSPDPTCDTVFTTEATYTLEAQCVGDATCRESTDFLVVDDPAQPVVLLPDPIVICQGETVRLEATPGFENYAWTSNPVDPGVTPSQGPDSFLDATPDVTTTYAVTARDARGCLTAANLRVDVAPDPLPPAVDDSVRVVKELPGDVRLSWIDMTEPVLRFEVTGHACPARDTCPGDPRSATMDAAAIVAGPVIPGTQTAVHVGADVAGELVYYQVRATSPCRNRPGPTCNGWPLQLIPCP